VKSSQGSPPPAGGGDPAVLEEKILAERARQLGEHINALRAVAGHLSAERDEVIFELTRHWKQRRIARFIGVSEQRISIIVTRWQRKHMEETSEQVRDLRRPGRVRGRHLRRERGVRGLQ
jgi:hypothetical protein